MPCVLRQLERFYILNACALFAYACSRLGNLSKQACGSVTQTRMLVRARERDNVTLGPKVASRIQLIYIPAVDMLEQCRCALPLRVVRLQCCTYNLQSGDQSAVLHTGRHVVLEKYFSNILFRCATRCCRDSSVLRRLVSNQPLPSPSSSNRCVYAKTLASKRPGFSAPKNHS